MDADRQRKDAAIACNADLDGEQMAVEIGDAFTADFDGEQMAAQITYCQRRLTLADMRFLVPCSAG